MGLMRGRVGILPYVSSLNDGLHLSGYLSIKRHTQRDNIKIYKCDIHANLFSLLLLLSKEYFFTNNLVIFLFYFDINLFN